MAYNVIKGKMDGLVGQHGDQEIEGIKVFKNVLSASVFYDTDAESPCATENKVAFDELVFGIPNGILVYEGDKKVKTPSNLTFDGSILHGDHAHFGFFKGSAKELHHIPGEKVIGKVKGENVNYGSGLEAHRGVLKVCAKNGITVLEEGVQVDVAMDGGLSFKNQKLVINPSHTVDIATGGQNISDGDMILIHDLTRGEVRHTTVKNLYDASIALKIPQPAGVRHSLQYKGAKECEGSANLIFDPRSDVLSVKGTVKALSAQISEKMEINGDLEINGALYKDIKVVKDKTYDFQASDSTVLFDTTEHRIEATLPHPKDNRGRIITIKTFAEQKYKLSCHALTIATEGGLIDFSKEIRIKNNYSIRTFHCDGENWWIVNRSGT